MLVQPMPSAPAVRATRFSRESQPVVRAARDAAQRVVEALESRTLFSALLIQGTGNADTITFNGNSFKVNAGPTTAVPAGTTLVQIQGSGGGDTININATAAGVDLSVDAGSGNDRVTIGNGNLSGIRSTISVGSGADPDDRLTFNDKHATPAGTSGGYILDAFAFNGDLVNFSGFERLTLQAADSDDFINLNAVAFGVTVTIEGNGGNDTVDTGANSLDGNNLGPIIFNGGAGIDQLDMNDQGNDSGGDYFISANSFTSNHSALSITFSAIESISLHGGEGNDNIDGADAVVPLIFDLGGGDDTATGGSKGDVLEGDGGNDTLSGFDGDDTLIGNDDNDTLDGGFGTDDLNGGSGSDTLIGGDDGDTFVFEDVLEPDVAPEADLIAEFAVPGVDTLDFSQVTTAVKVDLTKDNALASMTGRTVKATEAGVARNLENITGSDAPDTLIGNTGANVILGGEGGDTITGNGGADTLDGQGGIDTINGVVDGSSDPASVRLEAENAVLTGGTVVGSNPPGFTGTGYADFGGQNSAAQFNFTRNAAGPVTLVIRYANGGTAARPLAVVVNGAAVGTLSFAPTGGFTKYASLSINANLIAGSNTIKLTATSGTGGPNVDSVTINKRTLSPVTFQAESATLGGGTVAASASGSAGFTGSGYADFGGTGSSVTFANVTRSTPGTTTLTFRFANGSGANRPLSLTVNGVVVATPPFAPTGAWSNWTTLSVSVSLLSGNNSIKLTVTGTDGPNLDSLTVS